MLDNFKALSNLYWLEDKVHTIVQHSFRKLTWICIPAFVQICSRRKFSVWIINWLFCKFKNVSNYKGWGQWGWQYSMQHEVYQWFLWFCFVSSLLVLLCLNVLHCNLSVPASSARHIYHNTVICLLYEFFFGCRNGLHDMQACQKHKFRPL